MTTTQTERRERVVRLPAPPVLAEDDPSQNMLNTLLPLTGVLGSVAMVLGAGPAGSGGRGLLMAGALVASALAMVLAQTWRQRVQRRRSIERARSEHVHALGLLSDQLHAQALDRRESRSRAWPPPTASGQIEAASDTTGLQIRLGRATTATGMTFEVDAPGPGTVDPVCSEALRRFRTAHADDLATPATVDLSRWGRITLAHEPASACATHDVVRALLLNASRRPATELSIAVLCTQDDLVTWDWLKWLPHAAGTREDACGRVRLVDHRADRLLARVPEGRHLLLVVTPGTTVPVPLTAALDTGDVTVLALGRSRPQQPADAVLELRVATDGRATSTPELPGLRDVVLDRCTLPEAAAVARRRSGGTEVAERTPQHVVLSPGTRPAPRSGSSLLRVPIGMLAADGAAHGPGGAVHLDLKEASQAGHGPHGLVVGATGSGKSELLRSLVIGLIATHLPDDLALVLVDFKGGATFADVADLPHVAACVTNLADDVTAVDRMQDALTGEMERRQELLHAHGHASVTAHRAARELDPALPALPHLFVCVDEFSELLSARPDFVHLFTAIGRLGRSLGIHLLLASQRLDEGRLQALEAHLSYRIALRTFSASESRAAIGVPDAHTLPRRPGTALLRTGADSIVRFDALHLGAPAPSEQAREDGPRLGASVFTVLAVRTAQITSRRSSHLDAAVVPTPEVTWGERLLDDARDGTAGHPHTHRIWVPPLDTTITLGDLRHEPPSAGPLRLAVGEVDRPRLQRREPFVLDLSGAGGHVAVVGAPRSGRSTSVHTLLCALALRRTPTQAHVHLVDLAGGALAPLAALPHVVSHVTRGEEDLLGRIVADVEREVDARERTPRADSPDLFVVVDGWGTLRSDHEDEERRLTALAPRALAVGVHLVVTALRWAELRPAFAEVVASRVELRLGDPFDSMVDRRAAALVPLTLPGRGTAPGPYALRMAVPSLVAGDTTGAAGVCATASAIARAWTGPLPRRVRDLPSRVELAELAAPSAGMLRVGLDDTGATSSVVSTTHLVVRSVDGGGRTSALRAHVREWLAEVPHGQVALLDPRGTLAGLVDEAHLLGHAATAGEATALVRELAEILGRDPAASGTRRPPVTVVVDDLDLLRDTGADLSPLLPLLPRAQQWGLRVALGTRADAASRMRDRITTLVEDLGATLLDLTGEPVGRGVLRQRGQDPVRVQLTAPVSDVPSGTSLERSPERRSA